ncbi:MAG: translocation/assembly module TamB domain-containing protein [Vicinamibacteria bacterium]
MSEIPPSGGADGPKPAVAPVARRSWPRRVARGVFVAGALAVAAIAVLLLFLHLPAGRSSVRAILEKQLSALVDGRVRLGSLDYDLLRGRVEVGDAQLDAEGLSLHVERAEATAGPWAGVRLRVVRPVVIVRDTDRPKPPEPAVGLAARPWDALDRLAAAELVDARVELRDARGTAYAVLGPLDATLEEGGAPRAVRVTLRDGVVVPPGGGAELKPLKGEGRLVVEGARLAIESATVAADGVSIDASGALERVSPTEGRLALRAGADIARLAAASGGARVEGRVLAEASATLAGGDATGTLRLATTGGITVGTLGRWNAAASGRFDSRRLVVETAEVTGSAARLAADGVVGVDGVSPTELRLRVAALDVRALARAAGDADLPVRALLEGSLRYTTKGLDPAGGRASGSLTLRPAPAPGSRRGVPPGVPLAGSADLAVEGRRVHLRRLRLEARDTRLAGELSLSPELDVDGRFEATVPLAAAGALAADVGAEARPELAGTIEARGTIAGPVKAPTVAFALRGEGLAPVGTVAAGTVSVEGAGRYAGGRVALEPLVLRSGGGQAVVRGGLPLDAASGAWDLEGEARALELGPLLAAAGVEARGPLNGRLRVDGPYGKPAARGDLDARLSLAGVTEPLRVTASGSFAEGRIDVERLVAEVAGGRVEAHGTYDTATRATKASGSASGLRLGRAPGWPAALRGLDGRVGGAFDVAGTLDAPVGTARVSIEETTLDGRPLPGVRLGATADGARLELEGATRTDAGGDPREATFLRGRGALRGDWPLRLELDVSALPAQALFDALPAAAGASIRADGRVVVEVSARDPRRVRYTGEGLALSGRLRELEWSTEPFRVQGGSEEATISGLRLSTRTTAGAAPRRDDTASSGGPPAAGPAGGTLSVDGRVPFAADRAFDLAVEGGLDLAALQAIAPEDRAAGTATLRARVRGTLEAPDVRGSFGLTGARGRFGGTRVSQAELRGRFEGAEAFLDEASARVLGGAVRATGSLPFAALGAGRAARLRFEATDVDLSRLAIPFAERTPETPSFLVSASGEISATAPRLDAVRAEGRFTRVESISPEGRVGLVAPAAWRFADGRFVQEPIRLAGPLGTVEARAEARLGAKDPGGSAVVAGPFDLRVISPFVPDTSLAGPARVDLRAAWGADGTTVDGAITVAGGRVTLETLQFTATKLEGEVRFAGDHATLHATAASGDGQLSADGRMSFGPGLLGPAELALDARRVPISYPEGFRGRATGVLRVAGDAGRYEVTGDVAVSQAYYTAEFDARGQSLDRLDYQLAAIDGETSLTERLPLRIAVRLADPVRVRNSQASLDIVGTFAVGGTLAQPVATGQLSLLEGGRLTIRRARVRPRTAASS